MIDVVQVKVASTTTVMISAMMSAAVITTKMIVTTAKRLDTYTATKEDTVMKHMP